MIDLQWVTCWTFWDQQPVKFNYVVVILRRRSSFCADLENMDCKERHLGNDACRYAPYLETSSSLIVRRVLPDETISRSEMRLPHSAMLRSQQQEGGRLVCGMRLTFCELWDYHVAALLLRNGWVSSCLNPLFFKVGLLMTILNCQPTNNFSWLKYSRDWYVVLYKIWAYL